MSMIAAIIGRLLLGGMFVLSGIPKVVNQQAAQQFIESTTPFSGSIALPLGIFEIVAGLLLMIGLMTRLVAVLLALYTVLTILVFYNQFTDPVEGTMALKSMGLVGGLLMVLAYGQMRGSYDHMRASRKAYDAELRAARAEGKAEGATAVHTDRVHD